MTYAYVDAEWRVDGAGDPPFLTVETDGTLRFGSKAADPPHGIDPDEAALLAFASLAAEVVRILGPDPRRPIEVTGEGILAALVRDALGLESVGEAPAAIVDTTGDPAIIADASRRVDDLGVLVLAGESRGRTADFDIYPDVHVRGLQIVGAAPLLSDPLPREMPAGMPSPVRVPAGDGLPDGECWYRIER